MIKKKTVKLERKSNIYIIMKSIYQKSQLTLYVIVKEWMLFL